VNLVSLLLKIRSRPHPFVGFLDPPSIGHNKMFSRGEGEGFVIVHPLLGVGNDPSSQKPFVS